ncbi:3-keto-5-aminohexanoate cleavage protein [Rhizobium sp. BK512]|nr:3-keto-5-aminohexanoate cleavage protein [Rhizobium sp. BK512]
MSIDRFHDNAEMVEKAVRIVQDLGGLIASPKEAREILGLPPR